MGSLAASQISKNRMTAIFFHAGKNTLWSEPANTDCTWAFGQEYYDCTTDSLLTTKDPIRFGGGLANLYSYVGGDPVNRVDWDGLVFIVGGFGGNASAPGIGGDVNGGFFVNTETGDIGNFITKGLSSGLQLGSDVFFGVVAGDTLDSDTIALSLSLGISVAIIFDAKSEMPIGFTLGAGPGAGAAVAGGETKLYNASNLGDLVDAIGDWLPGLFGGSESDPPCK